MQLVKEVTGCDWFVTGLCFLLEWRQLQLQSGPNWLQSGSVAGLFVILGPDL